MTTGTSSASTSFTKGNTATGADDPGIRCTCDNFRITLRPQDKLADAAPILETHLKYCPQAKQNWLAALVNTVSSGSAAFVILVLVIGWSIHEHGWPWIGR